MTSSVSHLGCVFISIPVLYDVFNVAPSRAPSLWSWD